MLKKLIIITFSFLLYSNAAKSDELKIAYVDLDLIIQKSIAGEKISKQLNNLNNNNIKKYKKKEKELADEEDKIIKQKNITSKEDFEKKVKVLRVSVNEFKKNINLSKNDVQKKRINATNELIGIINPILAEYSSKNSISFILHKKTVILGKTELDITNQILDLVNKKVETIKLN